MLEIASICLLLGTVLAARFNVFAVIAAVPVVLIVVSTAAATHGGWWVAIAMIVAAASVEFGYLGGSLLCLAVHETGTNPAAAQSADRPRVS